MIEETEKSVTVHVRRALQEELLQRVLEIVDSFFKILQKVILEDCLVHVSVSEWSSLGRFDGGRSFNHLRVLHI